MSSMATEGGLELLKGISLPRLDHVLTMGEREIWQETSGYVLLWLHGRHQIYLSKSEAGSGQKWYC